MPLDPRTRLVSLNGSQFACKISVVDRATFGTEVQLITQCDNDERRVGVFTQCISTAVTTPCTSSLTHR